MKSDVRILAYAGCSTCKKALAWLTSRGIPYAVRPIVDEPPTPNELRVWIAASGVPVRKWLNTSGQSYRAIGKERIDAATDAELLAWLAKDGKLVRRPVAVVGVATPEALLGGEASTGGAEALDLARRADVRAVLVGFREDEWARAAKEGVFAGM